MTPQEIDALVDEAIRSAMDTVQVGDFRDPSQAHKERDAAEEKVNLLSAIYALAQREATARELLQGIKDLPGSMDFIMHRIDAFLGEPHG